MQLNRYIGIFSLVFSFSLITSSSCAQLGFSFDIPKPKQYEDRQLKSEKSDQKKFTVPRRFFQNTLTHYNYFFNANNKLNEIVARAKAAHHDDFTQLLSFYNYDLDETARDSIQLDSVIYKVTSGIVLHDLRNDWADNLYLIWGAAHYLQKKFDSAYLTFQFINYAFAPKEKDGYYKYIGSGKDDNSAMSVSTNEKTNLTKKVFSRPPSRNEAFIWQIRNFLAWGQYPEAASLIATLKADPQFPSRLNTDLEEVEALYFYKQSQWDSSATHLANALDNATNNQERGRWEFLTAQMYELSGKNELAQHFYEKAIGHSVDPVTAVYARLYSIRVNKTGGDEYIEKNVNELVKMAKHDRFEDYRDIIYYMAAEMELERNDVGAAQQMLLKAVKYENGNFSQRNRAYLKLAELAYASKDYRHAANFYDSLVLSDPTLDVKTITKRKDMLNNLAAQTAVVERQDSLQRIAALPEDQRKDFVKQILKDLRKQAGLKETSEQPIYSSGTGIATNANTNIFDASQSSKGDWYFYNASLRSKGQYDFRTRWGNRPNVDNWRRIQAVASQAPTTTVTDVTNLNSSTTIGGTANSNAPQELTFDNLYKNLPTTDELLKVSNDSIANALFEMGKIYADGIEDCDDVIKTYERLRKDYPQYSKMDEVLFHLYYCYNKNGKESKANEAKAEMNSKFPSSHLTDIVKTGKDPKAEENNEATKTYESIYDLFIEGKFDEAVAEKKVADSLYGENYWTPQLLYIESVYYIKEREDSTAISELRKIQSKYPSTPLAQKATTMIDVLSRRKQIEDELTNYQIKAPEEKPEVKPEVKQGPVVDTVTAARRPVVVTTDTVNRKKPVTQPVKVDSVAKKNAARLTAFAFNAQAPHYAMIILNKVDVVFGNETRNAFARYNSEKYFNKTFELSTLNLTDDIKLVLIKPFDNAQAAIDYIHDVKPKAASEIIPWLKADKYSFSIISDQNLELLKTNPDLTAYKLFLDQNLPGVF